jgi:ligand-binding sensor domain-containing protein
MALSQVHLLILTVMRLSLLPLIWFSTAAAQYHFEGWTTDDGLPQNSIRSIIQTRDGYLWMTTFDGLVRFNGVQFKVFDKSNTTRLSTTYRDIYFAAGPDDIWVGSIRGLSRYRDGLFHNTPLPEPHNRVEALGEDNAGRLWIGVVGGLLRYENGKLKNLSSLVKGTVTTILTDRHANVWVGSANGLFKFKDDQLVAHYTTTEGLPFNDIKVTHEDREGALWISTPGNLARFEEGKFVSYAMPPGLATNHIRCIYEDLEGTFWIGTYDDGLSRFREGRFFNYRMAHGLFDNGVFQILEDRHGYFWITCNKGIYRVSRQELNDFAAGRISGINSIAYGKRDGMLDIECNGGRLPSGIIARDGKFWFPTQGGVAVIDTEAVYVNSESPPVLIESVTLERNPIDYQHGITIQPGQRGLEISYTGLSYI